MREGARMVLPVGGRETQYLERIWRVDAEWHSERLVPVVFVPLVGRYGFDE
jgi:protein-L-isoaspartate O-methyltransferase